MKKTLSIALVAVLLAFATPVLQAAAPSNPWPVPVPQATTIALSAPSNPWPVPVPQSVSLLISVLLAAISL